MAKVRTHMGVKKIFLDFYVKLEKKWSIFKKNLLKNHRENESSEFFKNRLKFAIFKNMFILHFYPFFREDEAKTTTPIDFSAKK